MVRLIVSNLKYIILLIGILFSLFSAFIKFDSYEVRIFENESQIKNLETTLFSHKADFMGLKSTLNEMHNDISLIKNLLLTKGLKNE